MSRKSKGGRAKHERRQAKRKAARHSASWQAPPDQQLMPVLARDNDELERIRHQLTDAEYQAGLRLRALWHAGTLNPQPSASAFGGIGMPFLAHGDIPDDRLEANDQLRRALRSMGMLGMVGSLCVDVVCYDRPVHMLAELDYLRGGLGRLAEYA